MKTDKLVDLYEQLLGMVEYQKEEAEGYLATETEPESDPIGEWWQLSAEFLQFAISKPELLAEFLASTTNTEGDK